ASHRTTRLPRRPHPGSRALPRLLPRRPRDASRRARRVGAVGRRHLLRDLGAREAGDALRRPAGQPVAAALRRRRRGARDARGQGRPVLRRHLRHRRLPHGDLRRSGRKPPHAASPVRAVRV
ncbi:MAG: hypothetical protein AVDCRST_MAG38-1835, partial [uncultured Solirubrobacteraceae bacterium]